ncbi:MAG: hypothetical protein EOM91_14275 [Sphingobacteriia bacterium]|nr:hypothetical protein [Sphingobacteriia bacterium]NCC40234.1 hypothetical protein [Gammaproteobacteria bacterium]
MDRNTASRFKELLLGIPGWKQGSHRKAFQQDVFWGHALLDQLDDEIPAGRSIEDAFQLVCAQIRVKGIPEHSITVLMIGAGRRGPAPSRLSR